MAHLAHGAPTEAELKALAEKLPPAAQQPIQFDRDILPILEQSCFKCHTGDRPKGNYRLDSRKEALKSGDEGPVIVAGNSAASPLIHYVAGLIEDMQMPPSGKGDPLTKDQISLLRGWIDQGAAYSTNQAKVTSRYLFSATPVVQWISVKGDQNKFREHTGLKEGFSGGVQSFMLEELWAEGRTFTLEGSTQVNPEAYRLRMRVQQRDFGYAEFGFNQYREFYDDTGGFYPAFYPSSFDLGRGLELDVGRAWAEFGLRMPDKPQITLGYEYQYRRGSKSTLQWGDAGSDAPGYTLDDWRKVFPGYKSIDEKVHIIKFDLAHEVNGIGLENNFRTEFYENNTGRENTEFYNLGTQNQDKYVLIREDHSNFQASDAIRIEKQLVDWLFVSGGYYYSKFAGEYGFSTDTASPVGTYSFGDKYWFANQIVLDQDTHIFNANLQLGPWAGLNVFGGVQNEWMSQRGFGEVRLDEGIPGAITPAAATVSSNLDKASIEEHLGVRYTSIPYTVLFAEGRLQQESIGQREAEMGGAREFLRDTAANSDSKEGRVGFALSPWTKASLTAHYKKRFKDSSYNHLRDEMPGPARNEGYSAFITGRGTESDEIQAKLSLRPLSWLRTSLSWALVSSDWNTATEPYIIPELIIPGIGTFPAQNISPGGNLYSGNYDAQIVSANISANPWQRWYFSGTASYRNTRTDTYRGDNPSAAPYEGDSYSVMPSVTVILNQKTDLVASYSYSWADYGQNNYDAGLPLGLIYDWHAVTAGLRRQIKKNISTALQYRFWTYDEGNTDGRNNYQAHGVFASLTMIIP